MQEQKISNTRKKDMSSFIKHHYEQLFRSLRVKIIDGQIVTQ